MKVVYKTKNTCSSEIKFDLEDNIVKNVEFTNGCSGNLQAIGKLVDGLDVDTIVKKCKGIKCGRKDTSCADQLASAVIAAASQEVVNK
jgi:uncharacterized protein TIGR03905